MPAWHEKVVAQRTQPMATGPEPISPGLKSSNGFANRSKTKRISVVSHYYMKRCVRTRRHGSVGRRETWGLLWPDPHDKVQHPAQYQYAIEPAIAPAGRLIYPASAMSAYLPILGNRGDGMLALSLRARLSFNMRVQSCTLITLPASEPSRALSAVIAPSIAA